MRFCSVLLEFRPFETRNIHITTKSLPLISTKLKKCGYLCALKHFYPLYGLTNLIFYLSSLGERSLLADGVGFPLHSNDFRGLRGGEKLAWRRSAQELEEGAEPPN